jgi:sarcosine oxidase, subunit alpha
MNNNYRINNKSLPDSFKIIKFIFNGKEYSGFEGDTLASALLANGKYLVSRSFKLHRPRGIMSAGTEEASAIVQIHKGTHFSRPNIRATELYIYNGLIADSVNAWPSVEFDFKAINGFFSKLLVAGFYYKTFMWPKAFWKAIYEPMIRKMGGLGSCDLYEDPLKYERVDFHCDLLIVGSGPSGLSAAKEAIKKQQKIVLVDENLNMGSSLLRETVLIEGKSAYDWGQEILKELAGNSLVTLLTHTTLFGYYDHNYLCALQTKRVGFPTSETVTQAIWHFHAKSVILATGAHERPLVFKNNDLPGIMTASAVRSYLVQYSVLCGKTSVFFTNNDSVYQTAFDLKDKGVAVTAIVDVRADTHDNELLLKAKELGIPVYLSSVVSKANGKKHINSVVISKFQENKVIKDGAFSMDCDLLAVSGGWNPAVHLFSQSGGKLTYRDDLSCFISKKATQSVISIGSCNGVFDIFTCLEQGTLAGKTETLDQSLFEPNVQEKTAIFPLWTIPSGDKSDIGKSNFVDFMEDVTALDVKLAAQEGFDSVELLKRYTTIGMGLDQGKTSNVNAIGLLSLALDKSIPDVGTTKFRPPYTCVPFGAIAGAEIGNLLDPIRTTAIHDWHVAQGALFEDVGQWKRAWYYPKPGEKMQDSLNRECLAVRTSVGMMDASTLGKIDIQGKDAAVFLDLIYTNMFSTLKVGKCRYGLMCHEDGMVFDDGVTFRLGENHFYMTTTTGGAAGVLDWMEYWLQTEYPELEVYLASITEQYAAIAISGPKARNVLEKVCEGSDIDVSSEAIPYMSVQDVTIDSIPARIIRISFTGELAYELHVPAYYGKHIWEKAFKAGEPFGITPYGTETMHVLRAEKGFIIAGQDTDGSVTPLDLEMNWIVSKKKDFLGKRSFQREDFLRKDRKMLVGLKTKDKKRVLPEGAQIVKDPNHAKPVPMDGHVSSSYYSAHLGHSIALALIKGGSSRLGETMYVPTENGVIEVEVTSPVFYDPKGERQHV